MAQQPSKSHLPDFERLVLPTEQAAAKNTTNDPRQTHKHDKQYMVAIGSEGIGAGLSEARHDPEYYKQWREEKAKAVANGEDPYAEFSKRAKERYDDQWLPKLINKVFRRGEKGEPNGKSSETVK